MVEYLTTDQKVAVFESRRVQGFERQVLTVRNTPEDKFLAGDHLSHFLAIFEALALTAPFI
jgi:hypothetical protein